MGSMFCVYRNVLFSVIHRDGDGVPDGYDNCVDLPNGEQADVDDDKIGIPVKEIVHFLSRERGCYSFSESKTCEWLTVWPTTFGAEIVRTSNYFAIYQFTTGMKLKLIYSIGFLSLNWFMKPSPVHRFLGNLHYEFCKGRVVHCNCIYNWSTARLYSLNFKV